MYRRLESSIPPDFEFPPGLEGLGYFINDKDQIRMIDDPSQPFNYNASKNERFVARQKEAMQECIRNITHERLTNLNINTFRLPFGAKPDQPHVPIYASTNLATAERVIVHIGEGHQELGLLAGRLINNEGLNTATIVNLAHDVVTNQSSQPGPDSNPHVPVTKKLETPSNTAIVFANPGQLIWHRRGKKALSYEGWRAVPRKWGPGDGPLLTDKNLIPRNRDAGEHIQCLFDDFLQPLMATGVKIDVLAVGDSVGALVPVLDRSWDRYAASIEAVVCCSNWIVDQGIEDPAFAAFWGRRARMYMVDGNPCGTPLTGRQVVGCNVYASGEADFLECIVPRRYREFLDHFKLVHANQNYEAVPQDIPDLDNLEDDRQLGWGVPAKGEMEIDAELESDDEHGEKGSEKANNGGVEDAAKTSEEV